MTGSQAVLHGFTIFAAGFPSLILLWMIDRANNNIFPMGSSSTKNRSLIVDQSVKSSETLEAIFSRRDPSFKSIAGRE